MIMKVYGSEICVFMAHSRGATSGLLLSAVFTHLKPVLSISALCLHSTTIKNDSDDYEGLRIGNLHLHGAFTWRHFIVIGGFY